MSETSNNGDPSGNNDYYTELGNFQQANMIVPSQFFTQPMYYPYINPYSHLTEPGGSLSVHGYGSDGRPKFRRSRTIFSPEQLEILEQHFVKYKYPDVKRRRMIADEVGLPDERVQVWFQNRRAKSKRQTDQQVKLQKLVDEAICTNTSHEQSTTSNNEAGTSSSSNYHESLLGIYHEEKQESAVLENSDSRKYLPNQERLQNDVNIAENITFPTRNVPDCSEENDNRVWQTQSSSSINDNQVNIIQNIDQDLLLKVANILSASNDATSLIAEWSQSPNKTQTTNLEEQLRHFAEHHQQVLYTSNTQLNKDQ